MSRFEGDIEVEIERLVFRGMALSADRAEKIRSRVQAELAQLLGRDDWGTEPNSVKGDIKVGSSVQVGVEADDADFARELARKISDSIKK